MTDIISGWRYVLRSSFATRHGRARVRRELDIGPPFAVEINNGFGLNSPFPMSEIVLESPKQSGEVLVRGNLRVILIPSPPPLPTHQMLVAATRQLYPHVFKVDSSTSSDSESSAHETIEEVNTEGLIPCSVCMEAQEPELFPTVPITETCWHPNTTCLRCLQYSIASDHASKMWNDIRCPQCAVRMPHEQVKIFADESTFAHYDMLTTRQALLKLDNFVWCTSCSSGQFHTARSDCPEVVCSSCSASTCFTHRVPWHKGLTCKQYDRLSRPSLFSSLLCFSSPSKADEKTMISKIVGRRREAQASDKGIKRECKKCPGCKAMIYKIDGCKHMTCFHCTHEFCWRCKKIWFYGHSCWRFWKKRDY